MDSSAFATKVEEYVNSQWDAWFVPGISDFIRVPNLTPMVDSEFLTNGLTEKAMECVDQYAQKLQIEGLQRKIFRRDAN